MKYIITYHSSGMIDFPLEARIEAGDGRWCVGYGSTKQEARDRVIRKLESILAIKRELPPPEEIEV